MLTAGTLSSFPLRKHGASTHKLLPAWARCWCIFGAMVDSGKGVGGRGGKDAGSWQHYPLLFLSEELDPDSSCWVCPKLLTEEELNYRLCYSSKDQLKKKQIPLNSTISFSVLPHCPQNILHVISFHFFYWRRNSARLQLPYEELNHTA